MGPRIRAASFQTNKPLMNLKEESPMFIESAISNEHPGFSNTIWRTKALEILMITLRFISFITKSNFATSFKLINKNVFEIIGDVSTDFSFYLLRNFFKYEVINVEINLILETNRILKSKKLFKLKIIGSIT